MWGKMLLHGPVFQLPELDFQCRLLGLVGKKDRGLGREETHRVHGGTACANPGSALHTGSREQLHSRMAQSQTVTLPFSVKCSETSRQTEHKIRADHQVQLRLMPIQHLATCNSSPHPQTTTKMHRLYPWLLSSKL